MADFTSRASLAGAVDLSSLRAKNDQAAAGSAPANATTNVPDLIALGTEENLQGFVALSNSVPVIIEFFNAASATLSQNLELAVREQGGKVLLVRVDSAASPRVVQAFGVQNIPSVVAILKGQPIPLFEGEQASDAINAVIAKLIQVANENGVTGSLQVSDEPTPPPAPVVKHEAAYAAMEAADYSQAVALFESALVNSPADQEAALGLAQARLLLRTDGLDFEKVLASNPQSVAELLQKADACVAVGHAGEGYQLILSRFSTAEKDEREILRKHLIELFSLAEPNSPELAKARMLLASLLY